MSTPPLATTGSLTTTVTVPDHARALAARLARLFQADQAMSAPAKVQAMETLIEAHAIELKLPTVRAASARSPTKRPARPANPDSPTSPRCSKPKSASEPNAGSDVG
jgi:hypothetical protein